MKISASIFLFFNVIGFLLVDVTANCQPNVPVSSWDQLSEEIAVSLTADDHWIKVHIKNTSDSPRELLNQGGDSHIRLFYIGAGGAQVELSNHAKQGNPWDGVVQKSPSSISLPPDGEIAISMRISITPDELALIKTHPVKCRLLVFDPASRQTTTIESTPKMLVNGP